MRKSIIFAAISLILTLTSCEFFRIGYEVGQKQAEQEALRIQNTVIDSLNTSLGRHISLWKIRAGNQPGPENPGFDDTQWDSILLDRKFDKSLYRYFEQDGYVWLRSSFRKSNTPLPVFLEVYQLGASEIYINGRLVKTYGSMENGQMEGYNPSKRPFMVMLDSLPVQKVAVKIALKKGSVPENGGFRKEAVFNLTLHNSDYNLAAREISFMNKSFWSIIKMGVFLVLAIIHFSFFRTENRQGSNLYFALFSLCLMLTEFLSFYEARYNHDPAWVNPLDGLIILLESTLAKIFFIVALYQLFHRKKGFLYYLLIAGYCIIPLAYRFTSTELIASLIEFVMSTLFFVILIKIMTEAINQGKRGAKIFATGVLLPIVLTFVLVFVFLAISIYKPYNILSENNPGYIVGKYTGALYSGVKDVIMAICLSLYISMEFTRVNKTLEAKLVDIDRLSKEKQSILESQKEVLEEQVKTRTAELHQSLETLKATQNQLIQTEKLASLGELTAGIAHEIQNPLNFVNNFSELSVELIDELKELEQEENQDKGLKAELLSDLAENQQKINHHGKRASNIVKGMLAHSRAATGERALTNLNELADEYLRLAFHGMRAKNKTFNSDFKLETDPDIPELNLVPQDFGRVLLNLINNAFYSVYEKSKRAAGDYKPLVEVKTEKQDNRVIIRVKDNGSGIPEEIRARIFQPFFTTKPTGEGTGLGLSLSYDIITKGHNGSLEVKSTEGEYCEFIITLPV